MKLSDLRCSRLRVFVFGQSNILYRPKNQLLGADFSREELFRNGSDIVKLHKLFCAPPARTRSSLMGLLRPHRAVAPAPRGPSDARGDYARPYPRILADFGLWSVYFAVTLASTGPQTTKKQKTSKVVKAFKKKFGRITIVILVSAIGVISRIFFIKKGFCFTFGKKNRTLLPEINHPSTNPSCSNPRDLPVLVHRAQCARQPRGFHLSSSHARKAGPGSRPRATCWATITASPTACPLGLLYMNPACLH
jgi:hypothetical protein